MDNGTERAAEPNDQVNAAANEENTALRSQAEPVESTSATPDACSVKDGGTESSDASDAAYNSTEAPAGESAIDATADEAEAAGDPLDGGEAHMGQNRNQLLGHMTTAENVNPAGDVDLFGENIAGSFRMAG